MEGRELVVLERREQTRFKLDGLAQLLWRKPPRLPSRLQKLAGRITLLRSMEGSLEGMLRLWFHRVHPFPGAFGCVTAIG